MVIELEFYLAITVLNYDVQSQECDIKTYAILHLAFSIPAKKKIKIRTCNIQT